MLRTLLPRLRSLSSATSRNLAFSSSFSSSSSSPSPAAATVADDDATPLVDSAVHGDFRKAQGTGGRKAAVAQVWLRPGEGEIMINDQHPVAYFDRPVHRHNLIEPFIATNTVGRWDVRAVVKGGGLTGQAEAVRHGIAMALRNAHPLRYTKPLRDKGLTTRDPRMVERKKPGQPKARKKFAWVKR